MQVGRPSQYKKRHMVKRELEMELPCRRKRGQMKHMDDVPEKMEAVGVTERMRQAGGNGKVSSAVATPNGNS